MHARGKEKIENWDRQVPFKLIVNGELICTYKCDFMIWYADGRKELVEVKGYWTPEAKLKLKLFQVLYLKEHPEIIYTIAS